MSISFPFESGNLLVAYIVYVLPSSVVICHPFGAVTRVLFKNRLNIKPYFNGSTCVMFKQYAINGAEEADNKSLETDNSGILIQSVAQNPGAIGYVALPYLLNNDTVDSVSIDGVAPTLENTYNGTYSVWGYEHIYTSKEPKAAVKAFIEYITGADYGKRIEELGYGVSSKMQTKEVH